MYIIYNQKRKYIYIYIYIYGHPQGTAVKKQKKVATG